MQQLRSEQRGCRRQDPCPEAAIVVEVVNVAERSHGAVVGAVHDRAEHEADQQAAEAKDQCGVVGYCLAQHRRVLQARS